MQFPLLIPEASWRPPRISDLPSWSNAKRVALDTETCDPTLTELGPGVRRGAYIAGFSFAIEDGPKYYIPLRHAGGDNVEDPNLALGWLKEQAANFTGEIVGANLSYDLDFLSHVGITFPRIKYFRDVQVAEPLIWELAMSYSLETICQKYLGVGKEESLLREAAQTYKINPKKDLYLLPARFVGPYAIADAALPLLALRRQERIIEEEELWKIYNMESELLPVLVKMRQRGVLIDQDKLTQVEKWSVEQEREALAKVKYLTGHEITLNTVWTATALVPALQAIGVTIPLTPKTKKPSIDKNFLNGIQHPVAEALSRARRVNKVRTTFVNSIREHMTNGRIHCTINQLRSSTEEDEEGEGQGARYGRCSSNDPNMQQQPARDPEIGPLWRSIYIPEPGQLWASADYSSQEPRQAVHYACSTRLGSLKVHTPNGYRWVDADKNAQEVAERYRNDPNIDPHQMMANMIMGREANKAERKKAKDIYLGLSYSMGGAKLCRSLGLPTITAVRDPLTHLIVPAESPEGKRLAGQGQRIFEAAGEEGQLLLDKFDAEVPFVRALSKVCERSAQKNGYVRTMAGRKCRFPRDAQGNVEFTHKSLNRIVQGSSADQIKIAMIAIEKAGHYLQLQVHDEVCLSVKDREEAEMIAKIMCTSYPLLVPSKVDIEIGKSWGEAA